jgi:hypothetical protein
MRTIKFRGKCNADGSTWVYGSLSVQGEAAFIGNPIWVDVNPDTVGQFTGLLDCNGVEIYEGDIVMADNTLACEVSWNNSIAAYCLMHHGEMYCGVSPIYPKLIRLVGNIHDNPEILSNSK